MNLLNFSSLQFKDEGGEFEYDPASFYTDEVFSSQEQLMEWAQSTAIPLGYVIVKGRSNKNSTGYTNKVLLMCDRGGVPRDRGSTGVRAAFSKKCNCPFKLQGYFDPPYGWRVNVKEHRHNHLPSENLVGHAYARRLSVDERKWVEQAVQMNNPAYEIPKVFHPYVRRIVNVKGNGNCGFRALAVALGYDDKDSTGLEWVRNEMLAEYDTNKDFYDKVFAMERVHKYVQMSYPKGGRPRVYWMSMPEGPILLANRLGLVINCLSLDESSTVFPFWQGPDSEMYRNQPISIALVHGGCHYVMVELEGKYPMTRVNPYWSRRNITSDAARWKDRFKDQLDLYVRLTNSPF